MKIGGGVIIAVIAAGALVLLLWSKKAMASTPAYDDVFRNEGQRVGLDWRLLKAVAMHESSLDPTAINDSNPDDPSYGLMQISCVPDGNGGCMASSFPSLSGWPPSSADQLLDPATNVFYGGSILAPLVHRYGVLRGIAMYNDYGARNAPADGPFPNQSYVDTVRANAASLGLVI